MVNSPIFIGQPPVLSMLGGYWRTGEIYPTLTSKSSQFYNIYQISMFVK